ncbi:hypothetical protein LBMAG56_41480 [Verrucomicrobiota bacterium]|nr:hypothetical protein LBMAG56_41480 [Verrucomicrobiota bacterium]
MKPATTGEGAGTGAENAAVGGKGGALVAAGVTGLTVAALVGEACVTGLSATALTAGRRHAITPAATAIKVAVTRIIQRGRMKPRCVMLSGKSMANADSSGDPETGQFAAPAPCGGNCREDYTDAKNPARRRRHQSGARPA